MDIHGLKEEELVDLLETYTSRMISEKDINSYEYIKYKIMVHRIQNEIENRKIPQRKTNNYRRE